MQQNLFDDVGAWSKQKLDKLHDYLHAYTTILKSPNQSWCRAIHYVDGFAGTGEVRDRQTREFLDGSARVALTTKPPFDKFAFIELDPKRAQQLRGLREEFPRPDISVKEGDCNKVLVEEVIPLVGRNERAFLLLDPYGLHVNWRTIEAAAEAGTFEVLINFPLMDILRNVVRESPEEVDPRQIQRMTAIWGSDDWTPVLYPDALFGPQKTQEHRGRALSIAFQERLQGVFRFVSDYVVMRNTKGAPLYSLIWAGHKPVAMKIVNDVFGKA